MWGRGHSCLSVTYRPSLKLSSVFGRWLHTHYEVCQREVVTTRTKLRWLDSSDCFWLKLSQAGEIWADVPFPCLQDGQWKKLEHILESHRCFGTITADWNRQELRDTLETFQL